MLRHGVRMEDGVLRMERFSERYKLIPRTSSSLKKTFHRDLLPLQDARCRGMEPLLSGTLINFDHASTAPVDSRHISALEIAEAQPNVMIGMQTS